MSESASTPTAVIRKAVKEDVPEILAMIRELAEYERESDSCKATEELLYKNLGFTGGPAYAHTFLIFEGDRAVGMALYFYNFGTWTAKPGIYLEDLFVRPECRGKGYGTALLAHLAKEVRRMDGGRLDWQVLDWNEPSIKFYKSTGARHMQEWMTMRVDGDGLDKLGALGPRVDVAESIPVYKRPIVDII
ncbi:N-acetyltransferase [Drechslerella dactyloides]|uniref:N-acetyltransferase n=1 Tax=Drechslerella dactyloides TaxID=74499 RepID=A0AAD6IRE9_DREDA|nr:N-acetyltransferase [Drechslerella dactyloides]